MACDRLLHDVLYLQQRRGAIAVSVYGKLRRAVGQNAKNFGDIQLYRFLYLRRPRYFKRVYGHILRGGKRAVFPSKYDDFVARLSVYDLCGNRFRYRNAQKLNVREKTAFALYCILPLVAIIFQNVFKGYAIAYASIVVAAEILFFFISVQKNIELAEQQERNKETRIRLMISQIQPHFMYNSLSAISTLITIDPPRAQASLDDFTEYLRHNLSSLTEEGLIPFEKELKHIKTYISIEKMRSNERVNVIYNVSATDFFVPPLSIQPIVENAVKHGILQKIEGGTVSIDAYETARAFVVEIKDDGVGFDFSAVNFGDNEHFGLNNIRFRIAKMCGGKLDVKSEKGKGTVVTVTFMK